MIGYIIQRRQQGTARFKAHPVKLIETTSYLDTTVVRGLVYEYRLASVSMSRDTSAFTYSVEATLAARQIQPYQVRDFTARNTTKGIEIALPSVLIDGVTGYRLYRRELGSALAYQPLATLDANTTLNMDMKTIENKVYVYTVTAIDKGQESDKVEEQTVRRRIPTDK